MEGNFFTPKYFLLYNYHIERIEAGGRGAMVLRIYTLALIITVIVITGISCTKANPGPSLAPQPDFGVNASPAQQQPTAHYLWGFYKIYIDLAENVAEITPERKVASHFNVIQFLEQGPCSNCISIPSVKPSAHKTMLVDVKIKHPFAQKYWTGFDVRGIAMFKGSKTYPQSGLTASSRALGDMELVNADGFTTLYNIGTIGQSPNGFQEYCKGKLSTPKDPSAVLNGYKRYTSDDPLNTRSAFYADKEITQTFDLDMIGASMIFGYAVDASWAPPTTQPVTDPMQDFPPGANCPEPWKIEIADTPVGVGLTDQGGESVLTLDIYDWQGKSSHYAPIIECPELFDSITTAAFKQEFTGYSRWEANIANTKLAAEGKYTCLIKVTDTKNDTAPPYLDLTSYQLYTIDVAHFYDPTKGWARTWGSDDAELEDNAQGVAIDEYGNTYVTGTFIGGADFDPGPGIDNHISLGISDVFLSKFDFMGNFKWARTWGSETKEGVFGIAADSSGNVYVAGYWSGTVDFDPGDGIDERISNKNDAFLSKFDPNGNFLWVDTFTGPGNDLANKVAADGSGNIYITGSFEDTISFEPGGDAFTSNGGEDAYLCKLGTEGDYKWACTWGGTEYWDGGTGVDSDSSGNVFVTGGFEGSVDFNPGPGSAVQTAKGSRDVFLSKFDSGGTFQWAKTWGYSYWDESTSVAADDGGNSYVVGFFEFTIDLLPGSGVDLRNAVGGEDVFMSKFNTSGDIQWGYTWGGTSNDDIWGVVIDGPGDILASGDFIGANVDLDPTAGTDKHTSKGYTDVFVEKFTPAGNFVWARTWGGTNWDYGYGIAADTSGYVFTTGSFEGTVDFDPGSGIDNHQANGWGDVFLTKLRPDGNW